MLFFGVRGVGLIYRGLR
jgi:hypothetical protein